LPQSRRDRVEENEVFVLDDDYSMKPPISLSEMLDSIKVVLFGFQEEHESYKYFANLHKNMRVIDGSRKSFQCDAMKHTDLIFVHRRYMGHSASWRAKNLGMAFAPYAILKRETNNIERLQNAMANVLARVSRPGDDVGE
jgi:hypothetical protein